MSKVFVAGNIAGTGTYFIQNQQNISKCFLQVLNGKKFVEFISVYLQSQ